MRRLEALIPIVLLALLVQVMAPVAAFRAVAIAASDPLHDPSICSGLTSAADAQTDPATHDDTQNDHAKCCAFCVGQHGGIAAIAPPPAIFVSLQRQYQQVSWLEAAAPMPANRAGSNAQARAPPSFS